MLAITLDSVVKSAPVVQTAEFEADDVSITGSFSEREAKNLALVLDYGALPVQLEPQAVQTVSASLGQDSLKAGVVSGLIGLLLVVIFMLVYYRRIGLVVPAGLCVSGALMWSIVSWLGETRGLALTLAGITGIIVSIGVTVDSYVVYFERLKDDVRLGRTLRSSAEKSFKGAYRTILAADGASLIGALLLYWLTVGSVRGFAFFLALVDAARHVRVLLLHATGGHPAQPAGRPSPGPTCSVSTKARPRARALTRHWSERRDDRPRRPPRPARSHRAPRGGRCSTACTTARPISTSSGSAASGSSSLAS